MCKDDGCTPSASASTKDVQGVGSQSATTHILIIDTFARFANSYYLKEFPLFGDTPWGALLSLVWGPLFSGLYRFITDMVRESCDNATCLQQTLPWVLGFALS